MTSQEFKKLHKAQPFRPFHLHLGNGRVIPVEKPEFAMLLSSGRTAVIATAPEGFDIVELQFVETVKVGNGRRESRKRRGAA